MLTLVSFRSCLRMKGCSFHSPKLWLQHSCDLMHTKTILLQLSNSDAVCHRTVSLDCVWGNMRPTSSISSLPQPKPSEREKREKRELFSFQASAFQAKKKKHYSLEKSSKSDAYWTLQNMMNTCDILVPTRQVYNCWTVVEQIEYKFLHLFN